MRPIPQKLKNELSSDKFYSKCCLQSSDCQGRIEWHHNLIFAGKQVNEPFCILPLCHWHHEREKHTIFKEKLNWIMWNRATLEQIKQYSKSINYSEVLERLKKQYGIYNIKG